MGRPSKVKQRATTKIRAEIEQVAKAVLFEKIEDITAPSEDRFTTRFRIVVDNLLRDSSPRIQLATLELMLSYGFGKPVQQTESRIETNQTFIAEVPPVSDTETWMKDWGNPIVPVSVDEDSDDS